MLNIGHFRKNYKAIDLPLCPKVVIVMWNSLATSLIQCSIWGILLIWEGYSLNCLPEMGYFHVDILCFKIVRVLYMVIFRLNYKAIALHFAHYWSFSSWKSMQQNFRLIFGFWLSLRFELWKLMWNFYLLMKHLTDTVTDKWLNGMLILLLGDVPPPEKTEELFEPPSPPKSTPKGEII